jgi:hypothetical protein
VNLTPKERHEVVCALVREAAHQRQMTGGDRLFEKLPGVPLGFTPAQLEELASRIERDGDPNMDLVS